MEYAYQPLEKIRPSTTHSWGAVNITGLDGVSFNVANTYQNGFEAVYNLRPITRNRNDANVEHKAISIRLSYTSKEEGKSHRIKKTKYYVIRHLEGCNIHLLQSPTVNWQSLQWDYNVWTY